MAWWIIFQSPNYIAEQSRKYASPSKRSSAASTVRPASITDWWAIRGMTSSEPGRVAARKAIAIIEELTATPELNKSYLGKVVRVVEFGAFVELEPGVSALVPVSEMGIERDQDPRTEPAHA